MSDIYHREIKITLSTCLAKPDVDIASAMNAFRKRYAQLTESEGV